ncbi:MAG: hypothetical protein K0Q72_2831 [Armatimonadetes bacterium]|jgi:hypothetical protein|nr:hypothetical protein [Armatimonadota bacterium]
MGQVLQLLGAMLVLAGYVLAQACGMDQKSYPYLLLNLCGSAILAALALADRQWGFLLLEGAWALISLASMISRWRAGMVS